MSEAFFEPLDVEPIQRIPPPNLGPMTDRSSNSLRGLTGLTKNLEPGLYEAFYDPGIVEPRRQIDPSACFYSGLIQISQAVRGVLIDERHLTTRARSEGLLNDRGAVTDDSQKLLVFVRKNLGLELTRYTYGPATNPLEGAESIESRLVTSLVAHHQALVCLWPWSGGQRMEWETAYGLEKDEAGNAWVLSTFSGKGEGGVTIRRSLADVAQALRGHPEGVMREVFAVEVADSTLFEPTDRLFEPLL